MTKYIITRKNIDFDEGYEQAVYNGDEECVVWDSGLPTYENEYPSEYEEMMHDVKKLIRLYLETKYAVYKLSEVLC